MALTREQILEAVASKKADVRRINVPEFGGEVFVGSLSIGEAERLGLFNPDTARGAQTMLSMLVSCLVDESGQRLLEPGDAEALAEMDFQLTVRLFKAVADANGLNEDDAEAAAQSFAQAQPSASSTS